MADCEACWEGAAPLQFLVSVGLNPQDITCAGENKKPLIKLILRTEEELAINSRKLVRGALVSLSHPL